MSNQPLQLFVTVAKLFRCTVFAGSLVHIVIEVVCNYALMGAALIVNQHGCSKVLERSRTLCVYIHLSWFITNLRIRVVTQVWQPICTFVVDSCKQGRNCQGTTFSVSLWLTPLLTFSS